MEPETLNNEEEEAEAAQQDGQNGGGVSDSGELAPEAAVHNQPEGQKDQLHNRDHVQATNDPATQARNEIVVFALSAIFVFLGAKENFGNVLIVQLSMHPCIMALSFTLLVIIPSSNQTNNQQEQQQEEALTGRVSWACRVLRKLFYWLFIGNPERVVYILYFSVGALGYNLYNFVIYHKYGHSLGDSGKQAIGQVEAIFGLCSSCFHFVVILVLRLLHSPSDERKNSDIAHGAENGQERRFHPMWKTLLLKSLLAVSVSLAITDILKEDFDQDKEAFLNDHSNLFIFYDLCRPLVVDFRLHTAIMLLCMVLDDRLERKHLQPTVSPHRRLRRDPNYGSIPQEDLRQDCCVQNSS